ncbi:MAG: DNA-directed RNA polymerase [Pseudomonadales bacterium]
MNTLADQLAWEKDLLERGAETYWANQDRLRANDDGDKGDGASHLIRERLREVAKLIEERANVTKGRGGKYTALLRSVARGDYLKVAFIGLQVIFQKTSIPNHNTLAKITLGIGARLEADLKCQMFEAKYPAYYNAVTESLKEQKVTDYMHKHKVFMQMFKKFDDLEWSDFDPEVQSHIGLRVLDSILAVFSDVFFVQMIMKNNKRLNIVQTTVQFDEWLGDFEQVRGMLSPTRLPLKIPPRAWTSAGLGGYYTPALANTTPFIKTKSREHKKYVEQHDPVAHRKAVNAMQRTAWQINKRVLEVQSIIYAKGLGVGIPSNQKVVPTAFPAHLKDVNKETYNVQQKTEVTGWKIRAKDAYGREQKRKAEVIAFMQTFKLANELRDWSEFYYVYTCDFRGRIYCATSGLSPQGADSSKGLIKFARAERLGSTGIKWLAIQGANTFGKDKLPYADRVSWIQAHESHIRRVVEDPINSREWWGSADKPYQFLAFCYDWSDCDYGKNPNAHSSIPVGLDGSCNGLQHFSAMLRDEIGAKATNLTNTAMPEDIYQEVANLCTQAITKLDEPQADKWVEVGITRKTAKRPVMTLPYGAKQKSARAAIFEWATDNWPLFKLDEKHCWEYSKWLTPHLWEAIGGTVVAARSAMDWLQQSLPKDYCKWLTPAGFPVYQYYKEVPSTRVQTNLCGILSIALDDYDCYGDPKMSQQRSGIAPNFVHSIDSTHMVMTINMTDFDSYAMIHDDFGTHAGNTEQLFKTIRKSFHTLYTAHDPLADWAEQVGVNVETMPPKGKYNIDDIHKAAYFFG